MSDFSSPLFEGGLQEEAIPQPGDSLETQLWNSLGFGLPQELGVGDARRRLPQLIMSAQRGQTYVVRNLNRPENEAVVLVSLSHLQRIAASMSEPMNGGAILAQLPFGDAAGLDKLAPAPLPNPGLPGFLGALLRSDISSD